MHIFNSTSAFFITVLLCYLPTNLAVVIVRFHREPVMETEDRSVSLKCAVRYKPENCDIDAKWLNVATDALITNANRYIITVNETEEKEGRHRNIFLTFKSLIIEDSGLYQCNAKCLNSGTTANGHAVKLNITADPLKGMRVSTWSGQLKADTTALIFSTILFFWYY